MIHLHEPMLFGNNKALTKNHERQSNVSNIAFFVSKIQQACYLLKGNSLGLRHKNEVRILRYGRVKAQNTRPVYSGNMCNRLVAISDTRLPVTKAGGLIKLKPRGGQTMPLNTSKRATIRTISAIHTQSGIIATIHTCHQKKAVIGRVFDSLDQLQGFICSQGLSLELLGGRA